MRRAVLFLLALIPIAGPAVPAAAQATFGTIRGTVSDAQQGIVPGVTVVATDEATNVSREALSNAEGLFEISNLRPGTYTVTASLSGFRKTQTTGLVLRAASIVHADLRLEVGGLEDVITVRAEGQNNITLESPAIARGLDEQQLRDLPRNSRDIQDFLTLNPNIVGGFDGIQFLGGRTYGASYIQDGQPSSAGIFGELSNAAPGLDAISEVQVLSNSYSAEYGGLAGVIVSTKRGANRFHGTSVGDYNAKTLNALTYGQTLTGVDRNDPDADTHDYRYGGSLTPFFSYGTDPVFPANTGRGLDGVGQFGESWRPDVTGDPNVGGSRGQFFDVTKYSIPAPGSLGNAKKGSLKGPGTLILNLAFYKDVVRTKGLTVEVTALLDNALNHPQFFVPSLGTGGFADLTDYLIDGDAANGSTATLGADTVGNAEGVFRRPGREVWRPAAVLIPHSQRGHDTSRTD